MNNNIVKGKLIIFVGESESFTESYAYILTLENVSISKQMVFQKS